MKSALVNDYSEVDACAIGGSILVTASVAGEGRTPVLGLRVRPSTLPGVTLSGESALVIGCSGAEVVA